MGSSNPHYTLYIINLIVANYVGAFLENHCQRLDEELKFKIQLLEQQLDEVKTRKEIEITEMDGKLQEEYEDRLQKALNELREVYDKQMTQNREDFGKLYESRVRKIYKKYHGMLILIVSRFMSCKQPCPMREEKLPPAHKPLEILRPELNLSCTEFQNWNQQI